MFITDFMFFFKYPLHLNSAFFFLLLRKKEEKRSRREMHSFRQEERKTVGRHLPAENMGIYCVSRIFR